MIDSKIYEVPEGYALVSIDVLKVWGKYDEVRNTCQFPTQQAEQEPVAYFLDVKAGFSSKPLYEQVSDEYKNDADVFPLYAAPVQQVDLTDDEIILAVGWNDTTNNQIVDICRAVIAAYKEKQKC